MLVAAVTLVGALAVGEMPGAATSCEASASDGAAAAPARDWVDAYIAGLEEDDAQDGGLRVGQAPGSHATCSAWVNDSLAASEARRHVAPHGMHTPRDFGDEWLPGGGRAAARR
jgi:hypothetical protein